MMQTDGLKTGRRIARPYCLHCYAALARFRGSTQACRSCDKTNIEVDQRSRWTLEKRFVAAESLVKSAIVAGMVLIYWSMIHAPRAGVGMGQGWAIGMPLLFGYVLWESASKITHKKPYFRAGIFWGGVITSLPLPLLLAAVLHEGDLFGLVLGSFALSACLGGLAYLGLRRIARWRDGYIARTQSLSSRG